jgi:excisionase family DNA binding protein
MAEKKFYSIKEAAEVLGVSPADVNQMRERNELHAYRDGADWKFKAEQIEERLAQQIRERGGQPGEEEGGDVLMSEQELGESEPSASGTVIGPASGSSADSDIQLASGGDDFELASSNVDLAGEGDSALEEDSKSIDELDLTLDEDLSLEDSEVVLGEEPQPANGSDAAAVDLASDEVLDDDDLVLGGGGSGSDITIGGDSGISLVDPADSGLSLEDPLDLGSGEESLELGEDDMLALSEEEQAEAPVDLEEAGDFDLTPLEESDEEDSESGSQVIALDTDAEGDDAPTMVGAPGDLGMPAMLEEEMTPTEDFAGVGDAAAAVAPGMAPAAAPGLGPQATPGAAAPAAAALPEAPYSIWNVLCLGLCVLFLVLTGMMCYDLLRHMWSWDDPYTVNSSLMDAILGLF